MPSYRVTLKETTYQEIFIKEAKDEDDARGQAFFIQQDDPCFQWDGKMFVDYVKSVESDEAYGAYISENNNVSN